MAELTCRQCGAELVPQTNFCRKCGAAISHSADLPGDEQPTALFAGSEIVATQRFDPRPTAPERTGLEVPASKSRRAPNVVVLIGIVGLLVLAAIVSTVA